MSPRKRIAAVLACGAFAALVPASSASAAHCPGADSLAAEQSLEQIEGSLHCLINERRAEAGLATVRPEGRLRNAAVGHSQDMVSRGFFAHDTPNGVSFIQRIVATGYTRRASSWLVGENLVWGTDSLSTPASMVQAWIDSPTHRENLLRARFRDLGIAAVRGTPYDAADPDGITVSSEYGVRKNGKRGGKAARAAKRARAKKRAARKKRNR
jgi:uncharacterized protein YkwD